MQKITARRTPNLTYAVNDQSRLQLPNVDRFHRLFLEFNGTVTVTLGTGSVAYTARAPYAAIRQVSLVLTGYRRLGTVTLIRASGYELTVWERIENPGFDDRDTPAVQAASALVGGANTIHFSLLLPFSVGETDFAGMLPLGGDRQAVLELVVDWAAANTDIATPTAPATLDSVTGTLTVSSETFQFLEGEPERLGLREDIIHQLYSRVKTVSATGEFSIENPIGVLHLRILHLFRQNAAYNDTTWDTFELVVEDSVRPFTATQRQLLDQQRYRGVDKDLPTGTYAFDRYWTRTWRDVWDTATRRITRFESRFNITTAPVGTTDVASVYEVAVPTPQAAQRAA